MKRLLVGILLGAILGVVCIVGASIRSEEAISRSYLFAFWYNRVIIGLVIGLMPKDTLKRMLVKGAVLGFVVSFAFYSSTEFNDLVGFIAGIVYGVIIAGVLSYFIDNKQVE